MQRLRVTDTERDAVFGVIESLPLVNLALYASNEPALDPAPHADWTLRSVADAAWIAVYHADECAQRHARAAIDAFLRWRRRRNFGWVLAAAVALVCWMHQNAPSSPALD